MFNQGISRMGDLLELGSNQGIIEKAGAFYSYGETKLGQGRENSKEFLTQHPEIADSVEARIREAMSKPASTPSDEAKPEATGNEYAIPNVTEPEEEE
jgi:recombination protein RecA